VSPDLLEYGKSRMLDGPVIWSSWDLESNRWKSYRFNDERRPNMEPKIFPLTPTIEPRFVGSS
jgi:hypothetical protein